MTQLRTQRPRRQRRSRFSVPTIRSSQSFERLEDRYLLATDLVYDQTGSLTGIQARLTSDANRIALLDITSGNTLQAVPLADFSGQVTIQGSNADDLLRFDPGLSVTLGNVTFDGGLGDDQAELLGNMNLPGSNLTVAAEKITVAANAQISTQSQNAGVSIANSGAISLSGIEITMLSGSRLLAGVTTGSPFQAGPIDIQVENAPSAFESIALDILSPVLVADRLAKISITGAEIVGGNVTITAEAATQTRWDDVGEYFDDIADQLLSTVGQISDLVITLLSPISGQVKIQKATGDIQVTDAVIRGQGVVDIHATATANSSFSSIGINSITQVGGAPFPFLVNVGYGETLAKANVDLLGTTSILAGTDVNVRTTVESESDVKSRVTANGLLSNADDVNYALSMGISLTQEESTVHTSPGSRIESLAGNVSINAEGDAATKSKADAIVFQDGNLGASVAVSVDRATVTTDVNGTVIASNPQGGPVYTFDAAQVVDLAGDWITLSGLTVANLLARGQELIYATDAPPLGGLTPGETYVVADLENVPAGGFSGTQRIRLAQALPLELDGRQTSPTSQQTLGQFALSTFPSSAAQANNLNQLAINLPGIATGDKLTYLGPNSPVTEQNITAQFTRNAAGDRVTRTDGGKSWTTLGLHVGQQVQLTDAGANSAVFTIQGFSVDGTTLIVTAVNTVTPGTFTGFKLSSIPTQPTAIGNLQQGVEYEALVSAGRVLLRNPANPATFITFAGAGTGIHGFSFVKNLKTFNPSTAVNNDLDTIEIPNHGFQTGDVLVYRTDANHRIDRDLYQFKSSNPGVPEKLGTASLPDAPIDGMENGFYYYVTRVDGNRIRLSESSVAAHEAEVIDLTGPANGTHQLTRPDEARGVEITAKLTAANLAEAGVELSDGTQPWTDVAFDVLSNADSLLSGLVSSQQFLQSLRSQGQTKTETLPDDDVVPTDPPETGGDPVDLAGTIAINIYEHTVEARVGSTATIKSGLDVLVTSVIEENTAIASISEATRNGQDAADTSGNPNLPNEPREDIEISIAFALMQNKNTSRAIVESNAVVDARRDLKVLSEVAYPLRVDSADALLNPAETVKEEGLEGFSQFLDGTLGLGTNLFNSWTSALGGDPGSNSADVFVLGAGIDIGIFDNESTATIGAAAAINQDPTYQALLQSVEVNATTTMEIVSVGHISAFNLSVPGIIESGQGAFESGNPRSFFQGIVNPFGVSGQNAIGPTVIVHVINNSTVAEVETGKRLTVNPITSSGSTLALSQPHGLRRGTQVVYEPAPNTGLISGLVAGEVYYIIPTSNPAQLQLAATPADAAAGNALPINAGGATGLQELVARTLVSTGADGTGLDVVALQDLFTIAVAQTGAQASEFGLTVSVTVGTLETTTRANIGTDVTVRGASVSVLATDTIDRYGIDGGFVTGDQIGVGAAVSVNTINRTTLAYIGSDSPLTDLDRGLGPERIAVGGQLEVAASAQGKIFALALAGALLTEPSNVATPSQPPIEEDPTEVGGISIAVGASVAVNTGVTRVSAFIDDPAVRGGNTTVSAISEVELQSIVVGGAVSSTDGNLNIAAAGAFAINKLENQVAAFIRDSDVHASQLEVLARDETKILSDGGGIAFIFAQGGQSPSNISVGIGVAVNEIKGGALAFIANTPVSSFSDITVKATYAPTIDALTIGGAGAVSTGTSSGVLNLSGAGAGAKNVVTGGATAYIIDAPDRPGSPGIVAQGGSVAVNAENLANITVDAGAAALALALSARGSFINLAIAASVAINEISTATQAYIEDANVSAARMSVNATSGGTIDALTIGGAAGGGAFSGAGSGNYLSTLTDAHLHQAIVNVDEGVAITATNSTSIIADAGGFSIALNLSQQSGGPTLTGSVGVGVAINEVTMITRAQIRDADVTAGLDIVLESDSTASIDALTMGGAGAASFAQDSAFTFAGAGAGSGNKIVNIVEASIDDTNDGDGASTIESQTTNVAVRATDNATIVADAGGIAFALGVARGNANVNVSVGISAAINNVKSDVVAFVADAEVRALEQVTVSANAAATIDALTIAGAGAATISPGSGGYGVTLSGAGTGSGNLIDVSARAFLENNAEVNAGGAVLISAVDSSFIKADAVAGALSFQVAGGGSVAIGVAISKNDITSKAIAQVNRSRVNSNGLVRLTSQSSATIEALTVGVAASVQVNPGNGNTSLSGAGAGAQSTNTIRSTVQSLIQNESVVTTTVGRNVELLATDVSTIKADSGGGSLALSASPQGLAAALAISAGLSYNDVDKVVEASILDIGTLINVGGNLLLNTNSQTNITALAVSVAASVAITDPQQGFGLALAGAGAEANNQIDSIVRSRIAGGANVDAGGAVELHADDLATISATVPAVAISVSVGVGVSIGVALSNNTINNQVDAFIEDAQVTVRGGSLILDAQSRGSVEAYTTPISLSISLGVAGEGGKAVSEIAGHTRAYLGDGADVTAVNSTVQITATSTSSTRAEAKGGGFGLLNIGVMLADARVSGFTRAAIEGGAQLQAASLEILTYGTEIGDPQLSSRSAISKVEVGSVGIIGAGGGKASSTISGSVEAIIGTGAQVDVSGALKIDARSSSTAQADAPGGAGGGVTITAQLADASVTGATLAGISSLADVEAGSLLVNADADKSLLAKILVAGVSILGGVGGKATATDSARTQASLGGAAADAVTPNLRVAGQATLSATSESEINTEARGGSGGGITGGGFLAESVNSAATAALVENQANIATGSLLVSAAAPKRNATATTFNAEVSIINVSVAHPTARVTGDVTATVGSAARITANGAVTVAADSAASAKAKGESGSGSLVNVAVFGATAEVGTASDAAATNALVGQAAQINAGSLVIRSAGNSRAESDALGVSVGLLTGVGVVNSTSNVYYDVLAQLGPGQAVPGVGPTASLSGDLVIDAKSAAFARAHNTVGAGGVVGVGTASDTTRTIGRTQATIGDGANIAQARNVRVQAESLGATADSRLVAGTGGVVSVGSTKSESISKPNVAAYIGNNAQVNASSGGLTITATARGEADAYSQSSGGGVIQVGVGYGSSTYEPTADAHIGNSSVVKALGDIQVDAQILRSVATPPSNLIQDLADDADGVAVNTTTNEADFVFPLRTGQTVQYQAPASGPIGGLVDGRQYNLIVTETERKVQFGNLFDGSSVDPLRDIINFPTAHNLRPGDAVVLTSGGGISTIEPWQTALPVGNPLRVDPSNVLYVRGVFDDPNNANNMNPTSIRLARTLAEATASDQSLLSFFTPNAVNASTDRIFLAGNTLANGQNVTYRAPAAREFLTEAVDTITGLVLSFVPPLFFPVFSFDILRDASGNAVRVDTNAIILPNHGFSTGDAVEYRTAGTPLGGLVNGRTYYVIRVDGSAIKLANTYLEAVGVAFDNRGNADPADDILEVPVTPIPLSVAGPLNGTHSLARNIAGLQHDQTYYVTNRAADGTFQLAATPGGAPLQLAVRETVNILQRNGAVASTTEPLVRGGNHAIGTQGVDLRASTGSHSLVLDLTSSPAGPHQLVAPGGGSLNTLVAPPGDGISSATGVGGSGGFIDVSVPTGKVSLLPTASAVVNADAKVTSGGNVSIDAHSAVGASSYGDTRGGGFVAIGNANAETLMNSGPTLAEVRSGAQITAAVNFSLTSSNDHDLATKSVAIGGGFGSGRDADNTISANADTRSRVQSGAVVKAANLLSIDATTKVKANSNAETDSRGFGASADSDRSNSNQGITLNMPATVDIQRSVELEADAVRLLADIAGIDATARAYAYSAAFGSSSYADAYIGIVAQPTVLIQENPSWVVKPTQVTGRHGVDIIARANNINVSRQPFAQADSATWYLNEARSLGTTDTASIVSAGDGARVVAGVRNAVTTPLITNAALPPELALYVSGVVTTWNSDAEIRGIGSAELIFNPDGSLKSQRGVEYNQFGDSIFLHEIKPQGAGQVYFQGLLTGGDKGTFYFDQSLERVEIETWTHQFFVGDIQTYATSDTGIEPKVTINSVFNGLEFDVRFLYGQSEVNITNHNPNPSEFGIRLGGLIDNPIGITRLKAASDIYSANFRQRQGVIRTNRLEIEAGGDVGGFAADEFDRIPIDIVEAPNLPAHIAIDAGLRIQVGIQGLLRDPARAGQPFLTTSDSLQSHFTAGTFADIMLLGGLNQTTNAAIPPFGIQVFEPFVLAPIFAPAPTQPALSPRTTLVTDHFRISSGAAPILPVGVFGSGSNPIEVTYRLGRVQATDFIDIYKDDPVTSRVNIVTTTELLSTPQAVNVDVLTNGFIEVAELTGDLRIGIVRSTLDDVTVSALQGSLVDVPDDRNPAGDSGVNGDDIIGVNVTVTAERAGIGSATNPIEIDSSFAKPGSVQGYARNDIFLLERNGDMFIESIASALGNVSLTTDTGGLYEWLSDAQAEVIGITLVFRLNSNNANLGKVGTAANPLEIDSSSSAAGGIDVLSAGDIYLTEILNELRVLQIDGITPATIPGAFLVVRDDATNRNDMIIAGPVHIRTGSFTVGDDYEQPTGRPLLVDQGLTIFVDRPAGDPDAFGSLVRVADTISANSLTINGGDDFDRFELIAQPNAVTNVFGGQPAYPVFPGDELIANPQGNASTNTVLSILNGRGTVTVAGRQNIEYFSIELIDRYDSVNGPINDPPLNSLPSPFTTDAVPVVMSAANGNGLSVTDPDVGAATNFSVSLSITTGVLALLNPAGVTVNGTGTPASPLSLVGSLAAINTALAAGVQFTPPNGFQGPATLTMISNDAGNSGSGGALTDTDTLVITINSNENDPPVNHLPAAVISPSNVIVLSTANGNALSVTDIDAGNAVNFQTSLTVAHGTLAVTNAAGVTVVGNGTPGNPLRLTGSLTAINTALGAGLIITAPVGFSGATSLEIVSNDAGNTGNGGPKSDTDLLAITVRELNDPPVNSLPANSVATQIPVVFSAANGNAWSVADPDAGDASNFTVLIVAQAGLIELVNTPVAVFNQLQVSRVQDREFRITGALTDINAALAAGLRFTPPTAVNATYQLTLTSDDAGNTGLGGPLTDQDSLLVTINIPPIPPGEVNDPPVNHLPANVISDQAQIVFSQVNGNPIFVTDVDAGGANNFQVTLTVSDGTLSLALPAGVQSSGTGTPATPLTLIGQLDAINGVLTSGLRYHRTPGFLGTVTLSVVSNDQGNTGAGGPLTDSDSLTITFPSVPGNPQQPADVNDPPVNQLPNPLTTSLAAVVLAQANGTQLSVTDIDAGNAANFQVTLSLSQGTLSLPANAGLTVVGNGTGNLALTGTLTFINAALAAGLVVTPPNGFAGTVQLTMFSNDAGNTGLGGPLTDTDQLRITFSRDPNNPAGDVNDPPVNLLPAPIVTAQTQFTLSAANGNAVAVSDVDAGASPNFTVRLTVEQGQLALVTAAGITATGDGTPGAPMLLTGQLADINAVLAQGLRVTVPTGFVGATSLQVLSNDQGATGVGGPLTDSDSLSITIVPTPVNQGPVNQLPAPVVTDQLVITFSQANANQLSVTDVDAGAAPNFRVELAIQNGTLGLANSAGVTVSGSGTLATPLVLVGTLANINSALAAGVTATLPNGFTGTTSLVITSNDQGNTGAGGPKSDTDLLAIRVVADPGNPNVPGDVNDPPVNHLPAGPSIPSAPFVFSQAQGNPIFVTDIDAGAANNFQVTLSVPDGILSLLNNAGVTASGTGHTSSPLVLTGSLANINAALAAGLQFTPVVQFFGTTLVKMVSNDAGNTGAGGPLTDTDYLPIKVISPENTAPRIVSVIADSSQWKSDFRDYVDGGFVDPVALGYRIPKGAQQLQTLPWVNIDRLKVVFSEDVSSTLDFHDFQLTAVNSYLALGIPVKAPPQILAYTYDINTFTATLILSDVIPAAVLDLQVLAAGVSDRGGALLDGEWQNGVTLGNSGDNNPGGDFRFRLFVLPGDVVDEAAHPDATRVVNSNDAQATRDRQNGFALAGIGAIGFDPRADLDGSNFVNSNDSQLNRDQQNAVIFRVAPAPAASLAAPAATGLAPQAVDGAFESATDLHDPVNSLATVSDPVDLPAIPDGVAESGVSSAQDWAAELDSLMSHSEDQATEPLVSSRKRRTVVWTT